VVKSRKDLAPHNKPYAHDVPQAGFVDAIKIIKPHVLIGATGAPGAFTEEVIRLMADINRQPVIFALSNPTSRAECTAEQAYRWSEGWAIFASGSPFALVNFQGKTLRPGQGNNAYIFPGIGLGALACGACRISDEMFLEAARVLADSVGEKDLSEGTLYPPLSGIRQVSLEIAIAVANKAYEQNLATLARPKDLAQMIEDQRYEATY
jgi:malate dehydrogenase (oxaloacetate-decarboxylating)(NADP+)